MRKMTKSSPFVTSSSSSPSLRFARSFSSSYQFKKISFLGAGKMAEALVNPLIAANIQPADRITIYDVSNSTMDHMKEMYPGISAASSIEECISQSDLIVCAVKPQNCEVVFKDIKNASLSSKEDPILLSIVAGKPIESFIRGTGVSKIARSMPNTPSQIGKGITVWSCTDNIQSDEKEKIKQVLGSFGKTIFVDDESFIDMATSISGSGPAYVFLIIESMVDCGVHMGFSREVATKLVHHTLLGSTLMAMENPNVHPAILKNSVTSPAGTTASAMYELENGKFRTVIQDAIWSCYRRSLEMGGLDSNVGPGRVITRTYPHYDPPKGECVDVDESDGENGNGK